MTDHFFNHKLVNLHYYKFGHGEKVMLCFHGYGMHGKQFQILEERFGQEYTFYGFDLFFHKQTKLHDQSVKHVKKGISKSEFCEIIKAFCSAHSINRFSIIGYSLGTHYATVLAEQESHRIDNVFLIAPSFLKILPVFQILSKNPIANLAFRKLFLSKRGVWFTLKMCYKSGFLDRKSYHILSKEMATPQLRFDFYANVTYLRYLQPTKIELIKSLNDNNVKCFFIFGSRDKIYPESIANDLIPKIKFATKRNLDEDHDLVNVNLPENLYNMIYDN